MVAVLQDQVPKDPETGDSDIGIMNQNIKEDRQRELCNWSAVNTGIRKL